MDGDGYPWRAYQYANPDMDGNQYSHADLYPWRAYQHANQHQHADVYTDADADQDGHADSDADIHQYADRDRDAANGYPNAVCCAGAAHRHALGRRDD